MELILPKPILRDKRKLALVLGLLLSLGFFTTSLVSYFVSRDAIRSTIVNSKLPLISEVIYAQLQKEIFRPVLISSMMANDPFVQEWLKQGERNPEPLIRYLKMVQNRYGAVTAFLVSENTRRHYSEQGVVKTLSRSSEKDRWYFRVRQMSAPYEVNFDFDEVHRNALALFINFKILDADGACIGATGVGLKVGSLHQLIRDYQARYKRNIYFVDSQGQLIRFDQPLDAQPISIHVMPGLRTISDRVLRTPSGSYEYRLGGSTQLLNVRFMPELKWYLFVQEREDDALSDIRKTLVLNLLLCFVVTGVVLAVTNTAINRYQRNLEIMATTDQLTGLANRQAFEVMAEQALRESMRGGEPLSVMLIDIDHFKVVNDHFGHLAGDKAIGSIADSIRQNLRGADIVCRWGGEEYLVFLKQCPLDNARILAEKIRHTVHETELNHEGASITLTISLGVTQFDGQETLEQLLLRADEALYRAKQAGRDQTVTA